MLEFWLLNMSIGKIFWNLGSLGFGVLVVAVSVFRLHGDVLGFGPGVEEVRLNELEINEELVRDLPESLGSKWEWLCPVESVISWGWVSLGDEDENARRKLWMGHQRLRSGYELVAKGNHQAGVERLMKGVGYLEEAKEMGVDEGELEWGLERYEVILLEVEELVIDEYRTEVGELIERVRRDV